MSIFGIVLIAFGVGFFITLLAAAILLYCPVVITVDSRRRQVQVRWLAILEYLQPLPGSGNKAVLRVAGRQIQFPPRKPGRQMPSGEPRAAKEGEVTPEVGPPVVHRRSRIASRRSLAPFLFRCLADSKIRRGLAKQLKRFWLGCFRSVVLARSRSSVSLPDPALNGMLAGFLSASGWGRKLGMGVNFSGENSLEWEFRLRPHRMVKAVLSFFCGLPFRAIFRARRGTSLKAVKRSI